MLPPLQALFDHTARWLESLEGAGRDITAASARFAALPRSYDALQAFAVELSDLPLRADWRWEEPDGWEAIQAACDPARSHEALAPVAAEVAAPRIESGFLASVCGCQLGKPLEVWPTLAELEAAGRQVGEWPIADYVTEAFLTALGRRHPSARSTAREHLVAAVPDDDINYTILGAIILDQWGPAFTPAQLFNTWCFQLAPGTTWGPEKLCLSQAAVASVFGEAAPEAIDAWAERWSPQAEWCGAAIRADAYGFACPGDPARAAELAWRDARCTHRRNGVYGSMLIAAAIAAAFVETDPLRIFAIAVQYIPQRSRSAAAVRSGLVACEAGDDWRAAYEMIHAEWGAYGHCLVFQELATMVVSLRFARDPGEGICLQVMQGNDTDSFGASIGSLLGVLHGPGSLPRCWLEPLNDTIHTSLANFHEQRLSAVARFMGGIPARLAARRGEEAPV